MAIRHDEHKQYSLVSMPINPKHPYGRAREGKEARPYLSSTNMPVCPPHLTPEDERRARPGKQTGAVSRRRRWLLQGTSGGGRGGRVASTTASSSNGWWRARRMGGGRWSRGGQGERGRVKREIQMAARLVGQTGVVSHGRRWAAYRLGRERESEAPCGR